MGRLMGREDPIRAPFFEIGPKAYSYGPSLLELVQRTAVAAADCGVQLIITPQYVDVPTIVTGAPGVLVFAQHVDSLRPGRGVGSVLPEAVKAAGAHGVLLNHVERRLAHEDLVRTVARANEVGLLTMVCADDVDHALRIAKLAPEIIIVEDPRLIAGGQRDGAERGSSGHIDTAIRAVCPAIHVLHGAGINGPADVYDVMRGGAEATGSSSAIFLAPDPIAMATAMIRAVRAGWDDATTARRM